MPEQVEENRLQRQWKIRLRSMQLLVFMREAPGDIASYMGSI